MKKSVVFIVCIVKKSGGLKITYFYSTFFGNSHSELLYGEVHNDYGKRHNFTIHHEI